MANSYGFLNRMRHNEEIIFKGEFEIVGTELFGDMILRPCEKFGDNSPSHSVMVKGRSGKWGTLGKAWTKQMNNPPHRDFFTVTLDGPLMAKPINLTAFPLDKDKQPDGWSDKQDPVAYDLVWSRPRKGKGLGAKTSEALDDDIPF